jgi:uncharacterized membrane protein YdbT with pleckstrin-like domain
MADEPDLKEPYKIMMSSKEVRSPESKSEEATKEPEKSPSEEEKSGESIGEQPQSQAEQLLSEPILIPRNPMALITRMIGLVFFFDVIVALVLLVLSLLTFVSTPTLLIAVGLLVLVKAGILMAAMLRSAGIWSVQSFYLTERQLIHRKGIANVDEHIYELDNIRHVRLFQDFLGRQFDFGHLELLVATAGLTETIRLTDLKNPEHYERVFQNYLG